MKDFLSELILAGQCKLKIEEPSVDTLQSTLVLLCLNKKQYTHSECRQVF